MRLASVAISPLALVLVALSLAAGCERTGIPTATYESLSADGLLRHLKLGGIVRDNAKTWALFLLAVPGREAEHLKLMAGQRSGDLEVLAIDAAAEIVDVRVGEQTLALSLAADGLKPEDSYSWLQRLTPDEHARLYSSKARREFVGDHAQAQERRQREELAREREKQGKLEGPPAAKNR